MESGSGAGTGSLQSDHRVYEFVCVQEVHPNSAADQGRYDIAPTLLSIISSLLTMNNPKFLIHAVCFVATYFRALNLGLLAGVLCSH